MFSHECLFYLFQVPARLGVNLHHITSVKVYPQCRQVTVPITLTWEATHNHMEVSSNLVLTIMNSKMQNTCISSFPVHCLGLSAQNSVASHSSAGDNKSRSSIKDT